MSVPLTDFHTLDEQTEETGGIPTIILSIGPIQMHQTVKGAFWASPAFKLVHTEISTGNGETVTMTPVCVSSGSVPKSMGNSMATSSRPSSELLNVRLLMDRKLHQIQQDAQHMTAESDVHPLLHALLRDAGGWTFDQSLKIANTAHRHGFTHLGPSIGSDPADDARPSVFATTGKVIRLQSRALGGSGAQIHMFILPGVACCTESTGSVKVTAHRYAFKYLSGEAPCPDPTEAESLKLFRGVDDRLVHLTAQPRAQTTLRQLSQSLREYESHIITAVAESSAEWPGRVITQLSMLPFST